jgi:uncharacterized protein YlxW (UPF0749 family)
MKRTIGLLIGLVLGLPAYAQGVTADDCRRQEDEVRVQFDQQEKSLRREIAERERQADEAGRLRLRAELEQRLAALRLQAAEARQRALERCRG